MCNFSLGFVMFIEIVVLGERMEEVHIDKITSRIKKLCYGLNMDFVDPVSISCLNLFWLEYSK